MSRVLVRSETRTTGAHMMLHNKVRAAGYNIQLRTQRSLSGQLFAQQKLNIRTQVTGHGDKHAQQK